MNSEIHGRNELFGSSGLYQASVIGNTKMKMKKIIRGGIFMVRTILMVIGAIVVIGAIINFVF